MLVDLCFISGLVLFLLYLFRIGLNNRPEPFFKPLFVPSFLLLAFAINVEVYESEMPWAIMSVAFATGYLLRGVVYMWRK
jgi:hypothetical protein